MAEDTISDLPPREWLTPGETAAWLGVSPAHLERMRARGRGPAWRKWGARLIRYHVDDLRAFMEALPGRETRHGRG
jgi:excisionase family DNA binding protein